MSAKQAVKTSNAPAALPGIYSQAIVANGTVYCSGSIAMDPATSKIVEGDVKAHTVCLPSPSPRRPLQCHTPITSLVLAHIATTETALNAFH